MISKKEALTYRNTIEVAVQYVDDTMALEAVPLYPAWAAEVEYLVDARVKYNNILYRCLQTHISQENWNPIDTPSLWAKVLIPDETVIPEWEQPDSTNAYNTGDRVVHNGIVYESLVDNNVWEPGVIGTESLWKIIQE